ncbi:MAG TPA: M48 family metalloprotease [Pyrinomonadaceae bacterium]|nr:M48 family metalloprotease [Pyrinomonadaceae bacterium]
MSGGITISLSKRFIPKSDVRIAKVCSVRHLKTLVFTLIWLLLVSFTFKISRAQQPIRYPFILDEKDISETIDSFRTAKASKSVETFKRDMPKPVLDSKVRQGIIDNLPPYVAKLKIENDSLTKKVKQLMDPILSLFGREKVYDLIIVHHPTPLMMSDTGVVVVITTGMLSEVINDDELVGLIAHEVGHEYFAQYSIYTRYLLQKVSDSGNETALKRNLTKILMLLELQCDAFAAITSFYLGYDSLAFVDCLERIAKKFPNHSIDFHPSEGIRRKIVEGIFPVNAVVKSNKAASPLLISIKADLQDLDKEQ